MGHRSSLSVVKYFVCRLKPLLLALDIVGTLLSFVPVAGSDVSEQQNSSTAGSLNNCSVSLCALGQVLSSWVCLPMEPVLVPTSWTPGSLQRATECRPLGATARKVLGRIDQ